MFAEYNCSDLVRSMVRPLAASLLLLLFVGRLTAQNVTTQHNDIARTGANTTETVLTPSNVNTNAFGKLFTFVVDGYVYSQPLYMANVTMGAGTPQAGTKHNVVFVATQHDSVYAFDADGNLGANAKPLWQISLLDTAHGASSLATPELSSDFGYTDIVPEIGITSTPVIDPSTGTLYLVGKTKESGKYFYRLHALDITTGKENFGGPISIAGSLSGNGSGSSNGTLTFNPTYQLQRPGLLLVNGIIYIAFGATYDVATAWHGWIFAYDSTLHQTGVWCASPNGNGASLWLSGSGLSADVLDPTAHPYGRLFTATGNGSFNGAVPYTNAMNYSISVIRLDLAGGVPTMNANGVQVGDMFSPFDQPSLDTNDQDQGAGGALILPDAVSGGKHLMVQAGKSGRIYILDRDNLGGYSPNNTSDPQAKAGVGGSVYGSPAYWNGHIYYWPASSAGQLKSYSFGNGVMSSTPTSVSVESSSFPGAVPAVSANGTTNGIVWSVRTDAFASQGPAILYAHDATNVAKLLYSSVQNPPRDGAGPAVKFATPTITNGKVYIGAQKELDVYGLLNGATQAAAPVISPAGQQFHPSIQVTITDSSPGAQIFYTTDGTTPSTAATPYTGPFTVSSTSTINAIAAGTGLLASTVSSQTFTLISQVPTPVFSPVPGDYNSAQSVSITDTWPNATIYFTTDGTTPSSASAQYKSPVPISATTTLKAIAIDPSLTNSSVASGLYTINPNATSSVNFSGGFTSAGMSLVGRTTLSGTRLRLTHGASTEAAAAWYTTQVNVQTFSTDFNFQQVPGSIPEADGLTFAIQRAGLTAIGPYGGLAYGPSLPSGTPGIPTSIAVKFDLFNGAGEGNNSTGLYTNGASPTVPAVTLGGGVNLHSGDIFAVHINYDGATLTMTITDTVNPNQTFTTSWTIDIPTTIGGTSAYVGFTAGTGHYTSVQDILNWTYLSNSSGQPTAATPVISPANGTYSSPQTVTITDSTAGSNIFYTIDGSQPTASSTPYTNPFTVSSTTTVKAIATASGFTQSSTATSTITITSTPPAATPSIAPVTGTYSSPQTVTITDATAGSSIFYTIDGSQPTATPAQQYNGPFTVNGTTTVKAIATASGFSQSNTATSVITIQSGGSPSVNFASGFTATGLQFNGRSKLNGTRLQLTDGGSQEASSAWFTTPVNVQSFTNDFTFQFTNPSSDGMTFTIQNAGTTALGPSGGGLAYGPGSTSGTPGIPTSVAVKFDLFNNAGEGNNSTGLYKNGASPTVPATSLGGGVNLHSGDVMQVHMTYDGTTLSMAITDTVSNATFTTSWPINIPATVGANTAFVGFTGATGVQTITQIISWTYSSSAATQSPAATPTISPVTGTYTSPQTVTITDATSGSSIFYTTDGSQPTTSSTPYTNAFTVNATTRVKAIATASGFSQSNTATAVITIQSGSAPTVNFASGFTSTGLQFNGRTTLNGTRLQLTDGGSQEASSAWYTTPVNVQSFTNDFTFQFVNPSSDGMTFTIQNAGTTALGPNGGGLAYGPGSTSGTPGIPTSVAVKFDLFNNAGEGSNSTGLYKNGASPTVPATSLGGGVNLHSGDVMQVHMTYDGTTLSMTITDTVTNATFTTSWPINIPTTVGGNTALVGFTGATGVQTITQIVSWAYGP